MDAFEKRGEQVKYYTDLRNKHLDQLMASNGRLIFVVFVLVSSIIIGVLRLNDGTIKLDSAATNLFYSLGSLGVILISISAIMLSKFHTRRMNELNLIITNPKEFDALEEKDVAILPRSRLLYIIIFFGILSLLISALVLVVAAIQGCTC